MSMTENIANIAIANQALGLLGAEEIELDGSSQNHTYCTLFFDDARDEMLVAGKWNFAKTRGYAIQTTDPLFGYDNAFTVPDNCLKVLQIEEIPDAEFEVENALIVTDEGSNASDYDEDGVSYLAGEYISSGDSGSDLTYLVDTAFTSSDETTDLSSYCTSQGGDYKVLKIEYIYQHTTLSAWPVYAKQCFVLNLARMLCSPIKQDEKVALNLQSMLYGGKGLTGYLDTARSIDAQEGGITRFQTNTWIAARKK